MVPGFVPERLSPTLWFSPARYFIICEGTESVHMCKFALCIQHGWQCACTAGQFKSLNGTLYCESSEKALPLPSSHLNSSSKDLSQSSHPGKTGMGRNSSMRAGDTLPAPNESPLENGGWVEQSETFIHCHCLPRTEDPQSFGYVSSHFESIHRNKISSLFKVFFVCLAT